MQITSHTNTQKKIAVSISRKHQSVDRIKVHIVTRTISQTATPHTKVATCLLESSNFVLQSLISSSFWSTFLLRSSTSMLSLPTVSCEAAASEAGGSEGYVPFSDGNVFEDRSCFYKNTQKFTQEGQFSFDNIFRDTYRWRSILAILLCIVFFKLFILPHLVLYSIGHLQYSVFLKQKLMSPHRPPHCLFTFMEVTKR